MEPTASPAQTSDQSSAAVRGETLARLPEPLTSFVGREQEVQALLDLLRSPGERLVTLLGPGGVGKTRLALRVASEIAGDERRQVHVVQLAPITDPDFVVPTIGLALGVGGPAGDSMIDRIATTIGDSDTLLVLDNFERLVDAGPVLPELLSRCPGLTFLVTSRALLRLTDERVFHVRPLAAPADAASVRQVMESPAVRLFLDRSSLQSRKHNDDRAEAELIAVAEIWRRLDGPPLAIQPAAGGTPGIGHRHPASWSSGCSRQATVDARDDRVVIRTTDCR